MFKLRDWWRIMRRELAAGLMLGLILGAIGFSPHHHLVALFPHLRPESDGW